MNDTRCLPAAFALLSVLTLAACAGSKSTALPIAQTSGSASGGELSFVAGPSNVMLTTGANAYVVAPNGGRAQQVTRGGPQVSEAAWSADGTRLAFVRLSLHRTASGLVGHTAVFVLHRGGSPHLVHRCSLSCNLHDFAWSPDGRRIAFATNGPEAGGIAVMNADGSGFHVVCGPAVCGQGLDDPRWSPDGSQLLFSNMGVFGFIGPANFPSRVWVARPNGADAHPLTQPGCRPGHLPLRGCAYDSAASWSPNGHWIAFSRLDSRPHLQHGGRPRTLIELMHADGSDLHPVASCTGIVCNQIMAPVWSPDGLRLAYVPNAVRSSQIAFVTLAGDRSAIQACAAGRCMRAYSLVWSPDGRSLGFFGNVRSSTAYVINADGTGMHAIGHSVQCCLAWFPAAR